METIRLIKDGETRSFRVVGQSVLATMRVAGRLVSNPLLSALYADGWKDAPVPPTPEPILPTYAELVEQYIREHGYPTYGAELAVLNNYATDPTTYADSFDSYQQTRIEAKAWAESQPHREGSGDATA